MLKSTYPLALLFLVLLRLSHIQAQTYDLLPYYGTGYNPGTLSSDSYIVLNSDKRELYIREYNLQYAQCLIDTALSRFCYSQIIFPNAENAVVHGLSNCWDSPSPSVTSIYDRECHRIFTFDPQNEFEEIGASAITIAKSGKIYFAFTGNTNNDNKTIVKIISNKGILESEHVIQYALPTLMGRLEIKLSDDGRIIGLDSRHPRGACNLLLIDLENDNYTIFPKHYASLYEFLPNNQILFIYSNIAGESNRWEIYDLDNKDKPLHVGTLPGKLTGILDYAINIESHSILFCIESKDEFLHLLMIDYQKGTEILSDKTWLPLTDMNERTTKLVSISIENEFVIHNGAPLRLILK